MNGFVGKDPGTPYQNGIDNVYIYVFWENVSKLFLVGQTDDGYIQKVWVPYYDESQVYVLVSNQGDLADLNPYHLPAQTEFDPDYYTWFHHIGEETMEVTFYLDK